MCIKRTSVSVQRQYLDDLGYVPATTIEPSKQAMWVRIRSSLAYLTSISFVFTQLACTTQPPRSPSAMAAPIATPTAVETGAPRRIAVVPVRYEPALEAPPINAYTSGTLKNAGLGALGGAALGALAVCSLGLAPGGAGAGLCMHLAAPAAAGGAVAGGALGSAGGAVEGAPEQETKKAKAAVAPTAASLQLQLPLAEAVRSAAETATGVAPELFSQLGPTSPHQRATYAVLAKQGVPMVLETSVIRFGFDSVGGKDPDVGAHLLRRAHSHRSLSPRLAMGISAFLAVSASRST